MLVKQAPLVVVSLACVGPLVYPLRPFLAADMMRTAGFQALQFLPVRGLNAECVSIMHQEALPFYSYEAGWKSVKNFISSVPGTFGPWARHDRPTLIDKWLFGNDKQSLLQLQEVRGLSGRNGTPLRHIVHSVEDAERFPKAYIEVCPSMWLTIDDLIHRFPGRKFVLDIGEQGHLVRRNLRPDEMTCCPEHLRGAPPISCLEKWETSLPKLLATGNVAMVHIKDASLITRDILTILENDRANRIEALVWEGLAGGQSRVAQLTASKGKLYHSLKEGAQFLRNWASRLERYPR